MMNKEDIVRDVAKDVGIPVGIVREVLDNTAERIIGCVSHGEKVQLTGFGTFTAQKRAPRIGRNPHTNEQINIPERTVPVFKPSAVFKSEVSESMGKRRP